MRVLAWMTAAAVLAGGVAHADGGPSATVLRMGKDGSAATSMKVERGVRVYRGAERAPLMLAGAAPATPEVRREEKVVIVEHHYHSKIRHLRTQGFYSGHKGRSRRFTQGFYSGPVDKGRR